MMSLTTSSLLELLFCWVLNAEGWEVKKKQQQKKQPQTMHIKGLETNPLIFILVVKSNWGYGGIICKIYEFIISFLLRDYY